MSSLNRVEARVLELLFGMSSGYVLNFSDRTFGEFFADVAGIDIHALPYSSYGNSKAKKMRGFWREADDGTVGTVVLGLCEHLSADPHATGVDQGLLSKAREIGERLRAGGPGLDPLKQAAQTVNAAYLQQQIQRMEENVHKAPDLAIGTAKELVETVCRTVLAKRGKPVEGKPELPELAKAAIAELELLPPHYSDAAKGKEAVRRLLANLYSLPQGAAELRNLYGSGHGKDPNAHEVAPRLAILAVGAAATFARFLLATVDHSPSSATSAVAK